MATTVEVLADAFKEAGIPFLVGHPGGESVELMEAARQRGIRFLFVKQETAAAILAATWGEISRIPGVCLSTRGPGATNMVNGVAHALLDRAPLIAITDRYSAVPHEVGLRQRIFQQGVYAPIVKWSTTIVAKAVRQQVRRAIRTAIAAPPGPVHFDMPQSETTAEAADLPNAPTLVPESMTPEPDRAGLKVPLAMLDGARRPVIVAGLGVLWADAAEELVALAERLDAPVLTTAKCKGVVPEDHSLRAGCVIGGLIERKLVAQSDLIVTVGLDAVELQPKPWPYSAPVLSLAASPTLDALVPAALEVLGGQKQLLSGLARWGRSGSGWGEAAAAEFRRDVASALNTPSRGLSPQRAIEIARASLPRDTIATCDAGASRLLVVQKWQSYQPREFLTSNGLGTMGYAIPAAMAARLAHPGRPVVAFTGDGGFLMALAEMQTCVREKLPIVVVVFDDQEIGLIRIKQEIKGLPRHGVALGGLDWEKLAQGFGANGVVVDTENGLADALRHASEADRATVVAVRIDPSGYIEQFNALREI